MCNEARLVDDTKTLTIEEKKVADKSFKEKQRAAIVKMQAVFRGFKTRRYISELKQ